MYRTHAALLLAAASLAAAPLAAQTPITPGQTVAGTLGGSDPQSDEGVYYDTYVIRGQPGDRVMVEMRSPDFDTFLSFGREAEGGDWLLVSGNDDDGESTDSRLLLVLGEPGRFELRASGLTEGDVGAYELRVTAVAAPVPVPIGVGETARGELTESDAPGQEGVEDHFIVRGEPGSIVTAHLESDDFDAYLLFGAWAEGQLVELAGDDDGGEDTNSLLVGEFGDLPEHRLVVRSFSGQEGGAYTLRLEAGGVPGYDDEFYADTGMIDTMAWATDSVLVDDGVAGLPARYGDLELAVDGVPLEATLDEGAQQDEEGRGYTEYARYAREGDVLVIEVSSADFDPVVSIGLGRGARYRLLEEDDDSGPDLDARAEFLAPQDGFYVIRIRAAAPGQTGGYRLLVSTQP
jgi:hypothetical protein